MNRISSGNNFYQNVQDDLRMQVLSRLLSGILNRLDELEEQSSALVSELKTLQRGRDIRTETYG